jgi:glycosyltransferase involved in cell wall biosynthesis
MMPQTKVLHVIARMNVGGTAKYVNALVANIPNSKLATGHVQGSEIEDPSLSVVSTIRIRHLGRKLSLFNDYKAWRELRTIIRDTKPEIVHTHTFKAGLIGRLILGNHKRIHTFHGHLFGDNSFSLLAKAVIIFFEKILAARTDVLVSIGDNVGSQLRRRGIGKAKLWVSIPPGIEPLTKIDKQLARNYLGLPQTKLLVGWLARVTEVKNPKLVIELAHQLPTIQFVMAGGGNLLNTIRQAAPENLLVLSWVDAAKFWSAVDIALSTSTNEGMPISLIEAQFMGLPVVATDVGSTKEVVIDNITGLLTSTQPEEIAVEIQTLILDHKKRKQMGHEATKNAKKRFMLDSMIKEHESIYRKLYNKSL